MFQFRTGDHQDLTDFIDAAIESAPMREWLAQLEFFPPKIRVTHLQQLRNEMAINNEPEAFIRIVDLLSDDQVLSAMNQVIGDVLASGMKTRPCLDGDGDLLKKFTALILLLNA